MRVGFRLDYGFSGKSLQVKTTFHSGGQLLKIKENFPDLFEKQFQ